MHFLVRLGEAQPERMVPSLVASHVDWLRRLHDAGTLMLCGPCSDGTAVLVFSCATAEEAEKIAAEDPFAKAGAYQEQAVVSLWLATPENGFLTQITQMPEESS